jgi:hypothetical protein
MAKYWVQLEGSGIDVPGAEYGDPSQPIRGFFVNRIVRASSESEATTQALASVREDWASGRFARFKSTPALSVTRAEALGFFRALTARNGGYVFHPGE